MPQMGESIAEGTLSRWLKKVGDEVKRDEPIFEISTDKVDAEIPAASSGVLAEILVTEGQTVAVQTVVARLETEKGAFTGGGTAGGAGVGTTAAAASAGSGAAGVTTASAGGGAPGAGVPPRQQHATAAAGASHQAAASPGTIAPGARTGTAGNGSSLEERLRTKSSPLVRKIAAEHGIEIASLRGSGIAGRVTKRDILDHLARGPAVPAAPGAPGRGAGHADGPMPEPWPGDVVEPMSKIRALTAEHMVRSKRTSAHVTSFFEIDLTRIARLRAQQRAQFETATGQKLTYLPFIIKATVEGLKKFPVMNASVATNSIIYRKQYNIGIAVALEWGLIVPVIKRAEELSVTGITKQLNDLAQRARGKKLQPHEVQDATFTITNPGVFGSLMGTPIISQPQVAILGVGAIEKRPKVLTGPDGEDTIAIRTCAYFSISFDHRIVDGADADQFMAFLKQTLESFPDAQL
jgi:2-oxoglutarate dehydrogenase E2 component (dihydrolipoamide succinyltransferase)